MAFNWGKYFDGRELSRSVIVASMNLVRCSLDTLLTSWLLTSHHLATDILASDVLATILTTWLLTSWSLTSSDYLLPSYLLLIWYEPLLASTLSNCCLAYWLRNKRCQKDGLKDGFWGLNTHKLSPLSSHPCFLKVHLHGKFLHRVSSCLGKV